jgi:hypothetical protein
LWNSNNERRDMKHFMFGIPEEEFERPVEFLRKELSPDMMEQI